MIQLNKAALMLELKSVDTIWDRAGGVQFRS